MRPCTRLYSLTLAAVVGLPALQAADNFEVNQQLRQQSVVNRKIRKQVDHLGNDLSYLRELMANSGVVDDRAMNQVATVIDEVGVASNDNMQRVVQRIGLAQVESQRTHVQEARQAQTEAVDNLLEAKRQARIKADRARMLDRLEGIKSQLEQLKEDTLEKASEELQGQEVNEQDKEEMTLEQQKIADQLEQLQENLENMEDPMDAAEYDDQARDI
ncbi:MAG: hypothetical protein ACOCXA_03975, partial [Planctomycetota bacterium]